MSMKQINTKGAPAAIGPYSQAIKTGDLLFASGQIPVNPATGDIADGGIENQAEQVLKNIDAILKSEGFDFSNVIKTTVFLKDLNDFEKVNGIYANYFSEPYPARSCVEVAKLPKEVLIEIEFVAATK